jgi:hypothetical protein
MFAVVPASRLFLVPILAAFALFLGSCTKDSDDDAGSGSSVDEANVTSKLSLRRQEQVLLTDENGEATLVITVPEGSVSARFEAFVAVGNLEATSIKTPSGTLNSATLSADFSTISASANSPVVIGLPLAGANLIPGEYEVSFRLSGIEGDPGNAFEEITVQQFTRSDSDLGKGTAKVNLVYIGALGGALSLKDDMREVIAEVRAVLARANISLDIKNYDLEGPETCPDPKSSPALYEEITNQLRQNSVHILICSQVNGTKSPAEVYTVRPSALSAITSSGGSVSVFSVRRIVGNDGRFNYDGEGEDQVVEDEFQLAIEELSQLVAHGLGLAHTVEIEGDRVLSADNLGDTPSCSSVIDCREERDVRENLLFPYPLEIPDEADKSYARSRITPNQAAVMQRSILVD